jgi:membrane-bound ClpP family serine protease
MEFFDNLEPLLRSFWYLAIPVSLVFLIQTVMTFVGADAQDGLSADFDGDFDSDGPMQVFSLRNLINFLLGFSWTGISFYGIITNKIGLILASTFVGAFFVFVFFLIIRQIRKLSEDNSFRISDTLGKNAEVYLTIPANKSGFGKVLISVKGSNHELQAVSSGDLIPTGSMVKVIQIENNNLLIVQKI